MKVEIELTLDGADELEKEYLDIALDIVVEEVDAFSKLPDDKKRLIIKKQYDKLNEIKQINSGQNSRIVELLNEIEELLEEIEND